MKKRAPGQEAQMGSLNSFPLAIFIYLLFNFIQYRKFATEGKLNFLDKIAVFIHMDGTGLADDAKFWFKPVAMFVYRSHALSTPME